MRLIKRLLLITALALSQDWPNLNRYSAENESLGPPEKSENRVVLMGDSITESWSVFQPEYFSGKSYINRGISGQTTPQMLIRFRPDVIDLKPKLVVILAGINDIAGNTGPSTVEMITDNIISMAELSKSNSISVILCSILPANDFSWSPNENPSIKILAVNKILREYALNSGIEYLDYYSFMVDEKGGLREEYGVDSVHPNRAGYQVMSELLDSRISKTLMNKSKR